jgi:hypothetical protein
MSEERGPRSRPIDPARRLRATVIAQRMRMLTGVREEILDKIPAERTRYTALAAVMICTASIGGFSMFFALSEIMGQAGLWFVVLALFWTVFILCIDSWLVSSTAGSRWRTRISVLLPRLAIAAVFGIVIAEPLVLRVFQTGIVSHVRQERQAAIDNLRAALVACNPVPGIPATARRPRGGCSGMILNISNAASAAQARMTALQGQQSALQAQVNTETSQLAHLQDIVNAECNGNSGRGLTGIVGDGPACQKDEQDVTNYRASHPLAAQNATLNSLEAQITSLQGSLAGQQGGYQALVSQAVAQRLQQETAPSAPIGMAERFQALTYLSLSNGFIAVASWFVRIFFILIDCLPVLVKFISGSTPYDRLIDTEVASAEKRFSHENDTRDAISDEENALDLWQAKVDAVRRRKEIDLEALRQDTERKNTKEDAVDELWRKKFEARRTHDARETGSDIGSGRLADSWFPDHDRIVPPTNGSSGHSDDSSPETIG